MSLRALLLDLDGTLLDTAPEMASALNVLRIEEKRPPLPFDAIRPTVSHGSTGMVGLAFSDVSPEEFERLRQRFLAIYRERLGTDTHLFPGFDLVFDYLRERGFSWGVVTNKPAWLTDPLMHMLGIEPTNACIVSGDTVAERKPHPLPVLHAAKLLDVAPEHCLYVGDAERDIKAGNAAGMRTIVAEWGYLGSHDTPHLWNSHGSARQPIDLLGWFESGREEVRA